MSAASIRSSSRTTISLCISVAIVVIVLGVAQVVGGFALINAEVDTGLLLVSALSLALQIASGDAVRNVSIRGGQSCQREPRQEELLVLIRQSVQVVKSIFRV